MNGNEIIALLAPPIEVVTHLAAVYEINRNKGQPVPESCVKWLALWQQIRSDGKTEIDGTTEMTWKQAEKVVKREQVRV